MTFAAARAILRKDLAIELRTRQSVPAMALFSITVFVLFHFGLDRNEIDGSLASGVLWVTLLLATVLAVNRLFAAERDDGALDGILLAPIDRTAVYLAKAATLFLYLVVLEVIALPAFAILLLGPDLTQALPELLAIVALADVGLAGVGALVAGLASETRVRDVLVPILLLPLLVPVLIAAANATKPLLMLNPATTDLGKWLGFMALYDMVFVLLAVAVFDFLLED
jgi:heme exporter protein B